MSDFCIKF